MKLCWLATSAQQIQCKLWHPTWHMSWIKLNKCWKFAYFTSHACRIRQGKSSLNANIQIGVVFSYFAVIQIKFLHLCFHYYVMCTSTTQRMIEKKQLCSFVCNEISKYFGQLLLFPIQSLYLFMDFLFLQNIFHLLKVFLLLSF